MKKIKKTRSEARILETAANVKIRRVKEKTETKETASAKIRQRRMQRLAMSQTVLMATQGKNTRLWNAIMRKNGWIE